MPWRAVGACREFFEKYRDSAPRRRQRRHGLASSESASSATSSFSFLCSPLPLGRQVSGSSTARLRFARPAAKLPAFFVIEDWQTSTGCISGLHHKSVYKHVHKAQHEHAASASAATCRLLPTPQPLSTRRIGRMRVRRGSSRAGLSGPGSSRSPLGDGGGSRQGTTSSIPRTSSVLVGGAGCKQTCRGRATSRGRTRLVHVLPERVFGTDKKSRPHQKKLRGGRPIAEPRRAQPKPPRRPGRAKAA